MKTSINKPFLLLGLKIVLMLLILSLGFGPVFADVVLNDDSAQTSKDTSVTVNVLTNDTGLPDEYQVLVGAQPAFGTASVNPDGSITYSPNQGFTGSDSYIYQVNMFIDPTTANDDILVVIRDTPKTIDVRRNDFDPQGDPLDVTIQTSPSHGTAIENLDETITYTPAPGFTGSDSFTYQIDDGNGHTDTAIVSLSVQVASVARTVHYLAPRPQTGNIDFCGTPINLRVTTLNPGGATGTASFPGSGEPDHSFTIAQYETFQLHLDTSTAPPPSGGPDLNITHQYNTIENKGIKVTANTAVDVQITQDTRCWQSFLQSKGLIALGMDFYAGQMYSERYFLVPDDPGGFITVIATEDNTQVTFNVPPGATWNWRGTSQQTINVTLNAGQTYVVSAGFNGLIPNDLTGAHVTASKPIAVNSGAFGVYIPTGAGDHGWDQLVPVERIGAEYVIIKGSSTTEIVDVVATQDGTDVSVNGTTVATNLQAGQRYQFTPSGGTNTPTLIDTTKPAYVYQSSGSTTGENGMSLIAPIRAEGVGRVRFRAADSSTTIRAVLSTAALNTLQLTDITGGGSTNVPINIGGAFPVPGRPDLSIVQVAVTPGHEFIMGAGSFIQATLTSFGGGGGGGGGFSALSGFAITTVSATDDSVVVGKNIPRTFNVLLNDVSAAGELLSILNLGTPSHGTVTDNGDGWLTYTPDTDYTGADSFTYVATDGLGDNAQGTVNIEVQDLPQATVSITVGPTTAIELASFTVEANDGRAMVMWETGTEIDNAGFNLYRAASPDGPWVKVNKALIAAEGDPVAGASYSLVDTPGRGLFYYRLEDIDLSGVTTLHNAVSAQLGPAVIAPWFRPVAPEFSE